MERRAKERLCHKRAVIEACIKQAAIAGFVCVVAGVVDYVRKVQTTETLIEVAMIRLVRTRCGR